MFRKLLLATDGSARSRRAADCAVTLARSFNAELLALSAVPAYPYTAFAGQQPEDLAAFRSRAAADGNDCLAPVEQAARAAGVRCTPLLVEEDEPARAIVSAAAAHGADLIVLASHGRRGLPGLLLGSETQKVLALAACPVLVLR